MGSFVSIVFGIFNHSKKLKSKHHEKEVDIPRTTTPVRT